MPADYKSTLEELAAARDEAKEVLRELHGVLKDCKRAKAEVVSLLHRGTAILVLECLNETIDKQINEAGIAMNQIINDASDKVAKRFNEVARQLEQHEEHLEERERLCQETAQVVTAWLERQQERGYK